MTEEDNQHNLPGFREPDNMAEDRYPGLSSEPTGKFYADDQREHRLGMMLHLAPFGGVLLLEGEEGVGKSVLLGQFTERLGDNFRPITISADVHLSAPQLFERVKKAWLQRYQRDDFVRMKTVRRQLGAMRHHGLTPIMIIDDADQLADEVLLLLARLTAPDDNGQKLVTVVLAARAGLSARLEAPQFVLLQSHIIHRFELQPFAAEDSVRYIHHQLSDADDGQENTYPAALMKLIYWATGGVPERINRFVRVLWQYSSHPFRRRSGEAGNGHALSLLRWSVPLIIIVIISALYIPRLDHQSQQTRSASDNAAGKDSDVAMITVPLDIDKSSRASGVASGVDSRDAGEESGNKPERTVVTGQEDTPSPEDMAEITVQSADGNAGSDSAPTVVAGQTAPEQDKGQPDQQNDRDEAGVDSTEMAEALQADSNPSANESVTEEAPEAARQTVLSKAVPEQGESVQEEFAGGQLDEDWLLARPADSFTVQLVALELTKSRHFIQTNKLDNDAHLFRTTNRQGVQLSAVVAGVYDNRQAAAAAARQLDKRLGNIRSWVRPLASVQQSIRDYRLQLAQNDQHQLVAAHEERLLSAPPARFTLQLMAMDDKDTIAYIKKHKLLDKVLFFRTRGSGSDLLAAVTGEFTSKSEAEKAARDLSRELPGIRPWARSVASVQQAIRDSKQNGP